MCMYVYVFFWHNQCYFINLEHLKQICFLGYNFCFSILKYVVSLLMGITWAILFTCIFTNYDMNLSMGMASAILLTCNV